METVEAKEPKYKEKVKFKLPDKRVKVRPFKRRNEMLTALNIDDKDHDGAFLLSGAGIKLCIVYDLVLREHRDPLTEEERNFFESNEAGLSFKQGDLSVYKEANNFWINPQKPFDVTLDKEDLVLNLRNPMDYLRYKLLLTQKELICPTPDVNNYKYYGSVKYYLQEEDYEAKAGTTKADNMIKAYGLFAELKKNTAKMRDFLLVCGKSVSDNSKHDFLVNEIEKLIETNIDKFIEVAEDKFFDTKVFIFECVKNGHILSSKTNGFRLPDETFIGAKVSDVIEFLLAKQNNKIYLELKARLE